MGDIPFQRYPEVDLDTPLDSCDHWYGAKWPERWLRRDRRWAESRSRQDFGVNLTGKSDVRKPEGDMAYQVLMKSGNTDMYRVALLGAHRT